LPSEGLFHPQRIAFRPSRLERRGLDVRAGGRGDRVRGGVGLLAGGLSRTGTVTTRSTSRWSRLGRSSIRFGCDIVARA
jgi:hypothetical protein